MRSEEWHTVVTWSVLFVHVLFQCWIFIIATNEKKESIFMNALKGSLPPKTTWLVLHKRTTM